MIDEPTIAVYEEQAGRYLDRFAGDAPSAALVRFLDGLPGGSKLLDLGCGPGNSSVWMQEAGHEVDALDATEAFVELARKQGVAAQLGTFDDLPQSGTYDGIWANFSLLHASKSDFQRHLTAVRKSLKPSGRFHIGMKTGIGEGRDRLGRYYSYYTGYELIRLLEISGFKVDEVHYGAEAGLAGNTEPWIMVRSHA